MDSEPVVPATSPFTDLAKWAPNLQGLFLAVEGIDGSGKSTLAQGLFDALAPHVDSLLTAEPMDRRYCLEPGLSERARLFRFLADRQHHVDTVIRPALEARRLVICDRFEASTLVFQRKALRGTGLDGRLYIARKGLPGGPDFSLLVDIQPEVAYRRMGERTHGTGEYMSLPDLETLRRHRARYLDIFEEQYVNDDHYPDGTLIAGNATPETVLGQALVALHKYVTR